MTILVVADLDGSTLRPATAHLVQAASDLHAGDVHVLVAGSAVSAAAEHAATLSGVAQVLVCDAPELADEIAETLSPVLVGLAPAYSHVLFATTSFGKNVAPRVAALLDVQMVSDVIAFEDATTFRRPVYAGNAIATVRSAERIQILTVRPTAFAPSALREGAPAGISAVAAAGASDLTRFVERQQVKSDRPELTSARVVVSGGRGVGSKENFALIDSLADALGGAVGASRAAVDSGYVPNEYQVGQTGKVVAPELYVAVGLSGAIQHLAGMKDSKVIVAINKDPEAPIFQVADYGLVADLFQAVPELTTKLRG